MLLSQAASAAIALHYFSSALFRSFNPMSRRAVIAIRRHATCQHVQVISARCCLLFILEVLFRPGYLKTAFFGYRFTSVLSRRCGLFRTFDPTSRPTALTPKAVNHLIQRTTSRRSLQSMLHSGGFSASVAFEMLPTLDVCISFQYSELIIAQFSTLSMRVLELRAMIYLL